MDFLKPLELRALLTFEMLKERFPDRLEGQSTPKSIGFHFPLKRDDGNYFLSISYPPDYQKLETLLFLEDMMAYVEEWGYSDVRRGFGTGDPTNSLTIDAVVEEIRRIESLPSVSPTDH